MVLDASLLNTQHYRVGIKGKCPPLHLDVEAIEKRAFDFSFDYGCQLTYSFLNIPRV